MKTYKKILKENKLIFFNYNHNSFFEGIYRLLAILISPIFLKINPNLNSLCSLFLGFIGKNNKGVFSTKDYVIGQIVYTFSPQYIKQPTRTSIQHNNKHFEDSIGRYLNHNCEPIAAIVCNVKGIHLLAIEPIKKDDELTFDYNTTESKITNPFLCKCHGYLIQGNDV